MKNILSDEEAGFICKVSGNTIRGYGTTKGGNIYQRKKGVPYPEGVINLLKLRMKIADKKGQKGEVDNLKEYYIKIISGEPCKKFKKYIAFERERLEKDERGLSQKVLKKTNSPLRNLEESSEHAKCQLKPEQDYNNPPRKNSPKTRKSKYPYLTEEELNMPVTNKEGIPQPYDLIVSIMKEVDDISKTLIENPRTKKQKESNAKKQEKIRELWKKRRSIIAPWEDGVFNQN